MPRLDPPPACFFFFNGIPICGLFGRIVFVGWYCFTGGFVHVKTFLSPPDLGFYTTIKAVADVIVRKLSGQAPQLILNSAAITTAA